MDLDYPEKSVLVKEAVELAWPQYKAQTGVEPEKQVRIYIGDLFVMEPDNTISEPYGMQMYKNEVCHIYINMSSDDIMRSTTVHELFHCWQDTMLLRDYSENQWMWEATAVWAESWIYKLINFEQTRHSDIFPTLNENFFDTSGNREYGSYLYFYYLWQKAGFDPSVVINLLKPLMLLPQHTIMSSQESLNEKFKEYAIWNWNKEPFKHYTDTPSFKASRPSGNSIQTFSIPEREKYEIPISLNNGSMMYSVLNIDEDIAKIGPVRSARPYYLEWVSEFDSLYAHCGGSPTALAAIDGLCNDSTVR